MIDTHAHYDDERLLSVIDTLMPEMSENDVEKIITCATDYSSAEKILSLCEKYENLYALVGIYPHETHKCAFDRDKFISLTSHKKVVGIGEIGLDFYYDDAPKDVQLESVTKQIEFANEMGLPISFHDREAHGDSLDLLKKLSPKGVVHCFSGSVEMAKEIVRLGMYLGIGGTLTFKNARVLPQVVKEISLENLVLETDAPYLAPVPHRGKLNRSDYILHVAEKIAEIKGESVQTVLQATTDNAHKIFKF